MYIEYGSLLLYLKDRNKQKEITLFWPVCSTKKLISYNRKAKKPIETNIMNPIYEPLPGMNKPPQRFGSVAGSMRSFANMQPALAATGAPSMSGFSHRSKYLFYEDVDDTPIKMGSVYSPSIGK